MSKRVLFGTDGIRGEANVYPMTVEVALQLGKGLAHLVQIGRLGRAQPGHRKRIVIGKDTRLSGYCFEQAIAAGICSMGVDVMLVGPLPTPGIAFITQSMRADAGVVISASHNPFQDNGIKIFDQDGYKLPDAVEKELETLILSGSEGLITPTGSEMGRATRIDDAVGRYTVYVKSVLANERTLDGLKVVVDCAHGAAYKVAPDVFRELGAQVITIGDTPDGTNINKQIGAVHPQLAQKAVKEHGAHFGVALDGDADRVVMIDEKGELVHGDALMALVAKVLAKRGELKKKTLITTVMSNIGLEKCLAEDGIKVERTQVGDRYVVERMRSGKFNFGGEESGHLIFLDKSTTGDGLVAALMLVSLMLESGKPLSRLKEVFEPSPRALLAVSVSKRIPLEELPEVTKCISLIEKKLGCDGRVLVRYSGTERKVRVLVEGPKQEEIDQFADEIAAKVVWEIAQMSR